MALWHRYGPEVTHYVSLLAPHPLPWIIPVILFAMGVHTSRFITNANTRRAYRQDIEDFMACAGLHRPEQLRDITRAHVIAWRDELVSQGLANDTIRRKLAALSSLYAYFCDRNAVLHNHVLGVKRPRSMNRDGVRPALG